MHNKMIMIMFALFVWITISSAYNATDIQKKTDALDLAIEDFVHEGTIAQYDNFFLDNQEYAIAYVYDKPAYLLTIGREENGYLAKLVVDQDMIERVINKRYESNSQDEIDYEIEKRIREDIGLLEDSSTFFELKYDTLLGLDDSQCLDMSECEQECTDSRVCDYAFKKLGTALIENILNYEETKAGLDGLFEEARGLEMNQESKEEDLTVLQRYGEIIDEIETLISQMYSNPIFQEEHILYSGPVEYELDPLIENREEIEDNLLIGVAEQEFVTLKQSILISSSDAKEIIKIKEAEQERLRLEQERQAQQELQKEQQESQAKQEEGEGSEESSVKIDGDDGQKETKKTVEDGQGSGYLIPVLIASAILIIILIWHLWPKISKKNGMKKMQGGKVGKKEDYNLEDLI